MFAHEGERSLIDISLFAVRLYEHFNSSRFIYLILELCPGGDLSKYIRKLGRIEERVAQTFLRQLSDGLHFLQSKNLIHRCVHRWAHVCLFMRSRWLATFCHVSHRDLKPANVLLSESSEFAILKLADFGFAKQLAEAAMAQTPCGTPLYMVRLDSPSSSTSVALRNSVGCVHGMWHHG